MIHYNPYICSIKDEQWLERQRKAGHVLSAAIKLLISTAKEGTSTKFLDSLAEEYIRDNGCIPTFKGYKGFPAAVCISVNKELVHGIPKDNVILKSGDVLKLDSGATYEGAIADMARTIIIGDAIDKNHKLLVEYCEKSFFAAVNSIKFDGRQNRLGNIGYSIKKTAKEINANVIIDLGGHGLDYDVPHYCPFVYNEGDINSGPVIFAGMTLAIEPMLTFGSNKISLSKEDSWTISLNDIGVHYENTIFIHKDRVEIITGA